MVLNLVFKVNVEHATEKAMAVPSVCVRACVCVSLINRLTTKCGLDLSLSKPLSVFFPPSSVVFIRAVLFTKVVMRALTQHAHLPQTVWFSRTNGCRMLPPLLCV